MRQSVLNMRLQRAECNARSDSLGIRLIALSGRRTRIVRIADRLRFWVSTAYSTTLQRTTLAVETRGAATVDIKLLHQTAGSILIARRIEML